jgi:Na+/H+ antiporter NhaC
MASTLGVATFAYLPFAFFNIASIVIAIGAPLLGIGLAKKSNKAKKA